MKRLMTMIVTTLATWLLLVSPLWANDVCISYQDIEGKLEVLGFEGSPADGENVPDNVNDWSFETRFSTNTPVFFGGSINKHVKFLLLNFYDPTVITGLEIAWYKGEERTNDFEVFTDSWEHGWLSMYKGRSKKQAGFEYYALSPSIGNAVLIAFYRNSSPRKATSEWMSINEVKVYGYNYITDQIYDVFNVNH